MALDYKSIPIMKNVDAKPALEPEKPMAFLPSKHNPIPTPQ